MSGWSEWVSEWVDVDMMWMDVKRRGDRVDVRWSEGEDVEGRGGGENLKREEKQKG